MLTHTIPDNTYLCHLISTPSNFHQKKKNVIKEAAIIGIFRIKIAYATFVANHTDLVLSQQ